ncbi:MAG: RagB/SusD family nutrient uptake outer membrane protein [Chitinophagaceae bacterium]|nr:RagB/SusD family nutrient uptake outer membrane protein [Chitinophagaceae bacterium]
MKKYQYHFCWLVCIGVAFLAASCSKFMEVESREQVSDPVLWADKANADLFLNNVYSSLPNQMNTGDPEETWSDNAVCGIGGQYGQTVYALSAYDASNSRTRWNLYTAIRKANLFIEKASASSLPEDWKKQRLGEARFLRAYYYMILWTNHGGVPVITKVLNQNEQGDEIFQARNTAEETFKFIRDECEAIANDLPLKSDAGRATRGAALTLKGWVELFWASPLYNTSNEKQRWADAAATNKRVMDMNTYTLFPDYNTLFFEQNNNNSEVIFSRKYLGGTNLGNSKEGLHGAPWAGNGGTQIAWGGVDPTQEIVDEYVMANGLPISDPASGYDPQNPYVNREKRFYQSILFNGADWLGKAMDMRQGVGSLNATDLSNASVATKTGYNLKKGLNPTYTVSGNNRLNSADFIIYRYAEVLLSFAEAQNEAVGPDESVYEAMRLVRERSELPALPLGMSQAEMRVAIQRERRVELAFEEKRWLDLLRLRLAEDKLNGTSHAIVIEQSGGVWVHKIVPCVNGKRIFDPAKNYLLPIPQSAIDQNKKLEQNPNY